MPELDVGQADIHQRLESFCYAFCQWLRLGRKEFDGLIDPHIQNVIDIESLVFDFKDIRFETPSTASFTDHCDIRHELHADSYKALTLALRTTSTFHIEGEM